MFTVLLVTHKYPRKRISSVYSSLLFFLFPYILNYRTVTFHVVTSTHGKVKTIVNMFEVFFENSVV